MRCTRRGLLGGLLVLLTCVATIPRVDAQGAEGEAVLKAWETALLARDVEAVLQLFADDALVVTSSGRFMIGRDQIRSWVQDQLERGQREEAGPRYLQGAKLSWPGKVYRDDWQQQGISPLDVTQDAPLRDGKIRFFNMTLTPKSVARKKH
jgi:hypothetical protein